MINKKKLPLLLIILDGWGLNKKFRGNAIVQAETPNFDLLCKKYSFTKLNASGKYVGLPHKQVGNSEAGHMNISSGFVVLQDNIIIDNSIKNGIFFKNNIFLQSIKHINKNKSDINLIGLLSGNSSTHSSKNHIISLINLFLNNTNKIVYLHLFTDGRDSRMFSSSEILSDILSNFDKRRVKVASIMGRFYAMDRKKSWERIKLAYELLVLGKGIFAENGIKAIKQAYNRGESDEFILPTIITKNKKVIKTINDNDAIIFFNLRSDRARQLTKVLVQKDFNKNNFNSFKRIKKLKNIFFIALTDFGKDLENVLTAFPGVSIPNTLVNVLVNIRQLYIAETEKYAHVTYFFNGGYDKKINTEDRLSLASVDVPSYDQKPTMTTELLTKKVINFIKNNKYDFITLNIASPDMVAHTGNLKASIEAVEIVDKCLGKIIKVMNSFNGTTIITSDHGNIEEMIYYDTGEIRTEHTNNLVPFIIIDKKYNYKLKNGGKLANITPTILDILNINKPKSMKAKSLIIKK